MTHEDRQEVAKSALVNVEDGRINMAGCARMFAVELRDL
jgi:hypothetical protein